MRQTILDQSDDFHEISALDDLIEEMSPQGEHGNTRFIVNIIRDLLRSMKHMNGAFAPHFDVDIQLMEEGAGYELTILHPENKSQIYGGLDVHVFPDGKPLLSLYNAHEDVPFIVLEDDHDKVLGAFHTTIHEKVFERNVRLLEKNGLLSPEL